MTVRPRGSLAGQLYARLLLLTATIGIVMAAVLFTIVRADINARADQQLVTAAHVLFLLMREEFIGDSVYPSRYRDEPNERLLSDEDVAAFQASASWRQFAVFHDGVMVVKPHMTSAVTRISRTPGFQIFHVGDQAWRSYGLAVPKHRLLIVIAERNSVRGAPIFQGGEGLIVPMALLILGSAALLWFTLNRGLAEVDRLRRALSRRSPQDLASLDASEWSTDLEALIVAVNRLFGRVREAFEHEQALADRAAHQLRTPLAALKVQTQLLVRGVPSDRRAEADALLASVNRASETVTQMLKLARLDATELVRSEVDLVALATQAITDRALIAARAGVEFALSHSAAVRAETDAGCLGVALAALIDNAIAHAAGGGIIEIDVTRTARTCVIAVRDRGPGLSRQRRQDLMASDSQIVRGSSGLGFPIVHRAVTIIGAELQLNDRTGGGLDATISLPD